MNSDPRAPAAAVNDPGPEAAAAANEMIQVQKLLLQIEDVNAYYSTLPFCFV